MKENSIATTNLGIPWSLGTNRFIIFISISIYSRLIIGLFVIISNIAFVSWNTLLIEAESGDSGGISEARRPWTEQSESRNEERLLRVKAKRKEHMAALISVKYTEIRQIELFVVRLAESKPLGKRPLAAEINFS